MRANALKAKIKSGKCALNGWVTIGSSYAAEVVANQGYDSVVVDLQHGMIGFDTAITMLQAISTTSATPLVRVGKNDPQLVMQALDAGAYGVICPMISTAQEARDFVSYCRYPPAGGRSSGPARGLLYGGRDYLAKANGEILAIAQIETAGSLDQLDEICAIEGLDGLYVGPNDLAGSLGVPANLEPEDGPVADALVHVAKRAKAFGKFVGTHAITPRGMGKRFAEGYDMLTPGHDVNLLTAATAQALGLLREATGG